MWTSESTRVCGTEVLRQSGRRLVDTSGIVRIHFETFTSAEQAHRCVERLFVHQGSDGTRGEFLRSLGYVNHADLLKPMLVSDQRCHLPTFDVRGRILKKSHNSCHPDAVVVTNAELQLSPNAERWRYRMYYD